MILVVTTEEGDAAALVRWGARFAMGLGLPLAVLVAERGEAEPEVAARECALGDDGDAVLDPIRAAMREGCAKAAAAPVLRRLAARRRLPAVAAQVRALNPQWIVVGKERTARQGGEGSGAMLARHIFDRAPCHVLLMRLGASDGRKCGRILLPCAGGPHSRAALRLAHKVCEASAAEMVPFYVEPDGGEGSADVGDRLLHKVLGRVGINPETDRRVQPKIALGERVDHAVRDEFAATPYDLLLIGGSNASGLRQRLFGTVPDRLLHAGSGSAVGVVRRAKPAVQVMRNRLERWLHFRIPQLSRDERIALFEELQTRSRWSFDFMALMCFATGIASLGLILDSAPVVIGAMLVAPLMTPLLGSGLALVQGNLPLIRSAARAILYGFFCALAIGVLMGFAAAPMTGVTSELAARGGPSLLDMGVAFLSGIAASYCLARPGLASALAGVAIAAALVPPIATVGISLSLGEAGVARGAALLFATNVAAIIIGAAGTLWAIGVRAPSSFRRGALWVKRTALALIAALAAMAIPLGSVVVSAAIERHSESRSARLIRVLGEAAPPGIAVADAGYDAKAKRLTVRLESAAPPPGEALEALAAAARDHLGEPDLALRAETRIVAEIGGR